MELLGQSTRNAESVKRNTTDVGFAGSFGKSKLFIFAGRNGRGAWGHSESAAMTPFLERMAIRHLW
jgi:hypothetical protein